MKPFLLLSLRPEESLVRREWELFRSLGELQADELEQVWLEAAPLPELELGLYSGVIIGGSPYRHTTPDGARTATQQRLDRDLETLLGQVIERAVPCLATGYGLQALVRHLGGTVSPIPGRALGSEEIYLTAAGRQDPLLADLPEVFTTFVAHHDVCDTVPAGATVLAASRRCPAQILRFGTEIYGIQFNPEVDATALAARLATYEEAGFYPDFDDEHASHFRTSEQSVDLHPAGRIIRNFVEHNAELVDLSH